LGLEVRWETKGWCVMAVKIKINEKIQRTNYYEISYTFYLDMPSVITTKHPDVNPIKESSGMVSYGNDVTLEKVQVLLEERYNKEQSELNNTKYYDYWNTTWDGKVWS
jgi:hypothetical protein